MLIFNKKGNHDTNIENTDMKVQKIWNARQRSTEAKAPQSSKLPSDPLGTDTPRPQELSLGADCCKPLNQTPGSDPWVQTPWVQTPWVQTKFPSGSSRTADPEMKLKRRRVVALLKLRHAKQEALRRASREKCAVTVSLTI